MQRLIIFPRILFLLPELSTHMPYARNAWLAHTYSSAEAKMRAFPGYILSRTSQLLKQKSPQQSPRDYSHALIHESGICNTQKLECDPTTTAYRTHDGTCNNVRKPKMGATFTAFRRELPADYSDGKWRFLWVKGKRLLGSLKKTRIFSRKYKNSF
jgi:hypothetical protein